MRWEELSVPEIERLDRDRTVVVLPVGSVEQHGRHMPVGTDTILAHSVALAAAERLARPRRGAAAALVRILGASHALPRHGHAARRDDDGAGRGHRRERRRARLPPAADPQRPWRQQRHRSTCSPRRSAIASTERRGSPASPISSSPARRSRSCASRAPGGMGHACEFETVDDAACAARPRGDRAGGGHLSRPRLGLSHDRPARRLGGPHLPRFRRSFGERHARRSVARHARERRSRSTTRSSASSSASSRILLEWKIPPGRAEHG